MLDSLFQLKKQIEADLEMSANIEDNQNHLKALESVEYLISYLL